MNQPLLFIDVNQTDARYTLVEDKANTIRARYGTGGGNTPIILWLTKK